MPLHGSHRPQSTMSGSGAPPPPPSGPHAGPPGTAALSPPGRRPDVAAAVRVGDADWGGVLWAMVVAWVATRAEQAAAEALDGEQTVRMTGLGPQPGDIGAVMAIVRELGDAGPNIGWSRGLAFWP